MCLCEGSGSVKIQDGSVITFNECPDSHCKFDLNDAEKRYQKFRYELMEWKNKASNEGFRYEHIKVL